MRSHDKGKLSFLCPTVPDSPKRSLLKDAMPRTLDPNAPVNKHRTQSMSSHVHHDFAPPRSWEQFEELCADLFQAIWDDPMLIRHGRAGQRQHGVDIVGRHGARYPVGLQCKQKKIWPLKKLTTAEIDDEVNKAKGLVPKLQALWILTTAEDDAPVQAHVRAINESHATKGLFEVAVLGWSEIVRRVTLQHRVAAKHFGAWGAGETSPLLATFMIQDGSLETKDEALRVTVQELTLDLAEFPNGHVVVRRRESDHLLVQIKSLPSDDGSIDARKKRIELRKQLKAHTDRERTAERALAFALSDPHLAPMILQVWEDDAAETIRAIIEDSIDPAGPVTRASSIYGRPGSPLSRNVTAIRCSGSRCGSRTTSMRISSRKERSTRSGIQNLWSIMYASYQLPYARATPSRPSSEGLCKSWKMGSP